ncbi:11359_t:CDS:2, partial [Dentiscutata erythropus]
KHRIERLQRREINAKPTTQKKAPASKRSTELDNTNGKSITRKKNINVKNKIRNKKKVCRRAPSPALSNPNQPSHVRSYFAPHIKRVVWTGTFWDSPLLCALPSNNECSVACIRGNLVTISEVQEKQRDPIVVVREAAEEQGEPMHVKCRPGDKVPSAIVGCGWVFSW